MTPKKKKEQRATKHVTQKLHTVCERTHGGMDSTHIPEWVATAVRKPEA